MTDKRFEQLSKEIVHFCQMHHGSTQKCIDFVLYELELRCVSKDFLTEISKQIEPGDT